jgi:hypothetical protein
VDEFFARFEDLADVCALDNEEMVESLLFYVCDRDTHDYFKSLYGYQCRDYEALKAEILGLFPYKLCRTPSEQPYVPAYSLHRWEGDPKGIL